jgi:hypothetical protein
VDEGDSRSIAPSKKAKVACIQWRRVSKADAGRVNALRATSNAVDCEVVYDQIKRDAVGIVSYKGLPGDLAEEQQRIVVCVAEQTTHTKGRNNTGPDFRVALKGCRGVMSIRVAIHVMTLANKTVSDLAPVTLAILDTGRPFLDPALFEYKIGDGSSK